MTIGLFGDRSRRILAMVAMLATISGCQYIYHPWYLVEIDARRKATPEAEPEITVDRTIRRPASPFVVAVLPPDRCEDRAAPTTGGDPERETVALQIDCGEAMGDVERAIVARGWQVVSWKSIDQTVQSGRAADALEAAATLHANMVMQINSLEVSLRRTFGAGEISRTIRESNFRGKPGRPVSIDTMRGQTLDRLVDPIVESLNPPDQLGAFIDVTMVDVATGRSFWFYKWNHRTDDRKEAALSTARLFVCHRGILHRCLPRELGTAQTPLPDSDPRAQQALNPGAPESIEAAGVQARKLLDEATADMLTRLAAWDAS